MALSSDVFIANDTSIFQVSQAHLTLLEKCPRKFQLTYLDQLSSPHALEEQERLTWGSRFHLVMQQRELNLPIAAITTGNEQLRPWIDAFLQAEPIILGLNSTTAVVLRQSEQTRTLYWQNFLLVAIYDLLVATDQGAQILDWKTYPRPQNQRWITQSWQTRLYLYLLAETSDYSPAQLMMTYWFFQTPKTQQTQETPSSPEPQFIQISYNQTSHEQTHRDLSDLLLQFHTWLDAYEQGQNFPQVAESAGLCQTCQFVHHCQRQCLITAADDPLTAFYNELEQIPEIAL